MGVASWTVARVRGIEVKVHWTLLLVLPFFAYVMAYGYFRPEAITPKSLAWGGALAVTLFLSVLLHEFSHSFMALRLGKRVEGILLMPLGGISQMESMPEKPREEFLVTIVGPLTNFVLAAPLLALAYLVALPDPDGLATYVLWAGWLNVALGTFNLVLPAFPMDGGRLLRAGLASRMGLRRATRVAAMVGKGTAVLMALVGFLAFGIGGIWLILIAFFVYMGASAEESTTTLNALLQGRTAKDLMSSEPDAMAPEDTLLDVQRAMLRTHHLAFPVVKEHQVVGCIGLQELASEDPERFADLRVRDLMRHEVPQVPATTPAKEVLQLVQQSEHGHVVVVDQERLVGIVSRTDVERVVRVLDALGGTDGRLADGRPRSVAGPTGR